MKRSAALAAAGAVAFAARAAGPAGGAGIYEIVRACGGQKPCPPVDQRRWTVVLLDAPASDYAGKYGDFCSSKSGLAFRGCFWRNADHDGTLRPIAWSRKSGHIEVGLECGEDQRQQLRFKPGTANGTWLAQVCCTKNAKGRDVLAPMENGVTLKRLAAPDPGRCPQ